LSASPTRITRTTWRRAGSWRSGSSPSCSRSSGPRRRPSAGACPRRSDFSCGESSRRGRGGGRRGMEDQGITLGAGPVRLAGPRMAARPWARHRPSARLRSPGHWAIH